MPRSEARLKSSIWKDRDFLSLSEGAQRLYFLLLSQHDISLCGTLPYAPPRWAEMSKTSSPESVVEALSELEQYGYIVTDPTTMELAVRSLMRNDNVKPRSKVWGPAMELIESVLSDRIRAVLQAEAARIVAEAAESTKPQADGAYPQIAALRDDPSHDPSDGSFPALENEGDGTRAPARAPSSLLPPSPSPLPSEAPAPSGRRRPERFIPSDFALTSDMRHWAKVEGYGHIDLVTETKLFINHAKQNDRKCRDWVHAWRNWIIRSSKNTAAASGAPAYTVNGR